MLEGLRQKNRSMEDKLPAFFFLFLRGLVGLNPPTPPPQKKEKKTFSREDLDVFWHNAITVSLN